MNNLLQELSSASDSDSSGDESAGEEDKKEDTIDEDDLAEQAKLPQYASRFKVGVLLSTAGMLLFVAATEFTSVFLVSKHVINRVSCHDRGCNFQSKYAEWAACEGFLIDSLKFYLIVTYQERDCS